MKYKETKCKEHGNTKHIARIALLIPPYPKRKRNKWDCIKCLEEFANISASNQ